MSDAAPPNNLGVPNANGNQSVTTPANAAVERLQPLVNAPQATMVGGGPFGQVVAPIPQGN